MVLFVYSNINLKLEFSGDFHSWTLASLRYGWEFAHKCFVLAASARLWYSWKWKDKIRVFIYFAKKLLRSADACVVSHPVINELDGLKKDFQPYKYNNLQHAQYVLENARLVEK